MINILSIKCSLAFAPYLAESAAQFLKAGAFGSQVVRQAGSGLILRPGNEVSLRYQGRECLLGTEDLRHYLATIEFRAEAYDVRRMADEVVISTVGQTTLLSHPQSELWLDGDVVSELVRAFDVKAVSSDDDTASILPQWLTISTGSGRLLLSDGRTGRWVLLSADHVAELERRLKTREKGGPAVNRVPPTLALKGLSVHLQSAFKLAETLEEFANSGNVEDFEEITPTYSLTVGKATEGIELKDSDIRIALTAREARKWASIVSGELDRLNARRVERGRIRTVFVEVEEGSWVLQWGDEVFVPRPATPIVEPGLTRPDQGDLLAGETGGFRLLLNRGTGACVALDESELEEVSSS